MGALILLLLVTTRKMRQAAVARAEAEAQAAEDAARPVIRPKPKPQPVIPSGPTPEELAAKEAERAAKREAVVTARKRQSAREAEWKRGLAEAEINLDQRRQRVADTERELNELRDKLQATETNLQSLLDRKSQLKSDLDKDSKLRAKIEQEHTQLSEAIAAAQKKLADLRRAQADAASKFAFIPYDGASGTTRRPVYIECTSSGIRFQPENILLDEDTLKGFTESFNPLLVSSQRLMQYWREQAVKTDDPRHPSRPYILILVRPRGTISYYVARKMLSQLGDDFGYELIEDDFQLQLPPADPLAKAVIQGAIKDTLRNRGEMMEAGGKVGDHRLGEVLIGRSEEPIPFGTLDDEVAATLHREENPFKKNSGSQGKSFAITRSPVSKDELKSGAFKSTLAERDRQRAQGVPNSLAEMSGRGNGPGSHGRGVGTGNGNGAEVGNGTQARGVAMADNSRPGGTGNGKNGEKGFGLGDPFSREHNATGKTGAGSADTGERTAGDAAGDAAGGTGGSGKGPTGSRTGPRGGNGLPNGAKAGKVIDIPSGVTPIGDGTGSTGTRTRTTRRGPPGGKLAAGGQTPTTNESDGGGDPNAAGSQPPTGPTQGRTQGGGGGNNANGAANGISVPIPVNIPQGGKNSGQRGTSASNDVATAFRKPQPPEADSAQNGAETGSAQPNDGTPGTRGQRGGTKTRSTDPNVEQPRQYGDNPEARKQLASSSSSASVMQKRDAAKRRWGGSNTGQIGFERKVNVEVTGDRVFIERDDIEVIIEPGTTQDELIEAVLSALDEHSQEWGKPPSKFYWVPYLHFEIYPSGTKEYERLHGPLRDWGIFSEADFKTGERSIKPAEKGLIQPVSESKQPSKTSMKSTKPKSTGSAEDPVKKSKDDESVPAKKSPFSWFKKLGGKS
ncbi:MAG: hypothetical protein JWN70_3048 [Planctomycetaceae bacterium]|nr:hypothetical protein [Planctomycetaceae bacterium]